MKRNLIYLLCTLLCGVAQQVNAQVAFSLDGEASEQNTPEGWTAVQLPTGLPTLTAANTFDITAYGASTASADNTTAIQDALDAAAAAGGGMVVVPAGTYLTSYLQMGSKTVLHLSAGATLKMKAIDTYPTDANGYHKMENPLITGKSGASDIVIEGESRETSIIDGQGAPWWDEVETAKAASKSTTRQALIRFWQGTRYLFRNFRIQNAPNTNLTIGRNGYGSHATVHDITIKNPASTAADPSHNTDGFPIWTQYVNIYGCEIDTGDDNIVTDSGAQFVHVWNCVLKAGHGASLGSYTVDMHDIIYEGLTFTGTDCGFRLKSNRDRSGDVYNIMFRNCTMTNVTSPFIITSWYDTLPSSPEAAAASPDALIETTPRFHDILIKDVTVSGHTTYKSSEKNYHGIFIYGRPESKVQDVTFDNVNITHSKGIKMNFCEGIKFKNCSITVSNTNQTAKNGASTDESLPAILIEQNYDGSYLWNEHIYDITLDENSYSNVLRIKASNGGTGTVTLTRGITANKWSTIVLPFDIASTDIETIFGANTKVAELKSGTATALTFSTTLTDSKMKANQPYAIKVASNFTDAVINGVTIVEGTPTQTVGDWQFIGTYATANIPTGSYFFSGNKLYKAGDDSNTIAPLRAYFTYTGTGEARDLNFIIDGETTALTLVNSEKRTVNSEVYNLQGRKVANPTRGIYIVNGRKVVIK